MCDRGSQLDLIQQKISLISDFEATKFYNVSRDSPLSGELCEDDRVCNQVDDHDRAPEPILPKPGNDALETGGLIKPGLGGE